MVLSRDGYIAIEQLRIGDLVLTHRGRWRHVTSVMCRDGVEYREIRAQGCAGIITTDEHPFFAVTSRGGSPGWVNAVELERHHRLAQVLPPEIDHELSGDVLWLLGRFLADGWTWDRRVTGGGNPVRSEQGRVVICCAKRERKYLAERISRLNIAFNAQEERTVTKFYIANQEFWHLARQFGRLAHGKKLPGWCLELDASRARQLLDGYFSGDGSRSVNRGKIVCESGTVSKALAYGIALLVQRAHGIVAGIKCYRPTNTKVIEGRTVRQRERWVVYWYESGNKSAYIKDGYGWKLVRSNRQTGKCGPVYNISVDEDESYVADGAVVHNCQPHSVAGKRLGAKDERDLWADARRIIVQSGAWWCLIENVQGMLSSGGAERVWRDLRRLGFEVEGGLFTSAEVGAPHERKRVFILAVADRDNVGLQRGGRTRGRRPGFDNGGLDVGDSASVGRGERRPEPVVRSGRGAIASDGDLPLYPPGPGDLDAWREIIERAPRFEPAICRMADGMAGRVDRLRMLGNGVNPLQAAYAIRTLSSRLARRSAIADALTEKIEHHFCIYTDDEEEEGTGL